MIGLTINGATETGAYLARLAASLKNPAGLLKVLEREGRNRLVTHFRAKNTVPNKLGGRRSNYWQRVADSVTTSQSGLTVTLSITDPTFRQKVQGGTIRPKNAKALTIPVNDKAYGLSTKVFEQETGLKLFLLKTGTRAGVLAAKTSPNSKALEVFYVLARSVRQAPDPTALPPFGAFRTALVNRATDYVQRLTANQAPPS